jgi:hypothetical protein
MSVNIVILAVASASRGRGAYWYLGVRICGRHDEPLPRGVPDERLSDYMSGKEKDWKGTRKRSIASRLVVRASTTAFMSDGINFSTQTPHSDHVARWSLEMSLVDP